MSFHAKTLPKGFTLLEMAVVVSIIALLLGAVIEGKSLIRSARLLSVISDVKSYSEAVQRFQEKFSALPGDMPNATTYWGSNATNLYACGSYYSTPTSPTSTCNGNGDGVIAGGDSNSSYNLDEQVFLWKHLMNAGYITGNLTGRDMGAYSSVATGVDIPASKIPGGGYVITSNLYIWYPTGGTWIYPWNAVSNVVIFGSNYNGDNSQFGAVITSAEALSIDSKIDDGRPGTGKVTAPRAGGGTSWGTANCATDYDPHVAVYNVAVTDITCSLMFEFGPVTGAPSKLSAN